ncbi:succinyldiaminopimelate transaminase [Georgenia sp. Z1491]|uniref:succinyldiaminopimelate transaminase n=1 Tax=Georgenia sp. Z1491 TaxID=3416707 RepID=UPI003CF4FE34
MTLHGETLPDFPWDSLAGARERAAAHPGGIVDLSVGTPVDPTPAVVQEALRAAADRPGYPTTIGTDELRRAMVGWFGRRRGVTLTERAVLPTIGSKEAVALVPAMLGIGAGDRVLHPAVAYPTYDVGARLAGAEPVAVDPTRPQDWPREGVRLVWLNSPANPHGHVLGVEQLAAAVAWAREVGAVVVADECYAELAWDEPWAISGVPSLLDPRVTGGDHSGLLVAYSLSKQSSMAGYRAALLGGDEQLIGRLREIRKHAGMMLPGPVQAAMAAALDDDAHVAVQRERYGRRRRDLLAAVRSHGLSPDPASVAGLYLWLGREGVRGRELVDELAGLGVLVAPGEFYGPAGAGRVRMALTGSDERVAAAVARLDG